jgi:prepilin-type N-terminal cleavage/methylation domain-containing protein
MFLLKKTAGYTLLELLVVMLIFGLLTGMVTPRLLTLYDSTRFAYQRDDVIAQITRLNYLAFKHGSSFDLSHYPVPAGATALPPFLQLPPGW